MRIGRALGIAGSLLGTFFLVLVAVPVTRARADRIVVLTVVVYAAFAVRRRLGVGVRPQSLAAQPRPYDPEQSDEQDVRLARLDASLRRAAESGEQFARVTVPALRRLATERLSRRHGIDVTTDPRAARQQMGEELWQMFETPAGAAGPAPGRERLQRLVEALERL